MGARLGIVGGGQLARMLGLAAAPLGVDVLVLAGERDQGVRGLLPTLDGAHDDEAALRRLAEQVDVVTFDHELVPLDVVRALEAEGVVVRPSSATLAFADKLHQRRTFAADGLPVPPFAEVATADDVAAFADEHGWPVVLKAPHGGYDGRGLWVVDDLAGAGSVLAAAAGRALLAEPRLELLQELAVVVVTGVDGERVGYAPVESVQVDGMCREVHAVDGHLPTEIAAVAMRLGHRVAALVQATGTLAVELFVVPGDGPDASPRVLINEIAPRVHNSGHHTIDGCATSQFENHVRAVLGLPLGATAQRAPASVMVNVVGQPARSGGDADDPRDRVHLVAGDVKVHLYGKTPRPERKVGHVTAVGDDHAAAARAARRAAALLEGREG